MSFEKFHEKPFTHVYPYRDAPQIGDTVAGMRVYHRFHRIGSNEVTVGLCSQADFEVCQQNIENRLRPAAE